MKDPRVARLAEILVGYSTKVAPGDKVLLEMTDVDDEVVNALVSSVYKAGGVPFVTLKRNSVTRALIQGATEEQMKLAGSLERTRMEAMDAYVAVRGSNNIAELSDVPDERMKLFRTHWQHPVHTEVRVPKTRWCVLRWPTASMAQLANMSTEAFEEFYFDVCTFDYSRMARQMAPLKALMERTDRVRVTGPDTELTFSIKNIPVIPCVGEFNIPDGECFTAPVKDSVNGRISYNTPTINQGTVFEGITLTFSEGKIVDAVAKGGNTEKLNQILDSDEGARYVGEFSLGFNPYILNPMKDILFDEKIAGSFHFTPGNAYDMADNGNRSTVHWDMVFIQRPEWGGGEIYFDDVLIRKDGLFVLDDLKPLNPDQLKGA